MAKGSFLGVKRGKLGDAVGFNVTNSNDKDKQGWRVYQPVVRNPQSDGQMVQRCKMAAVNNLYRALKDVIKRGFENHKYGDDSRRAWLKVALGQDFSNGPWMVKGSHQPVPIKNVPITVGSLPPVTVTYSEDGYFTTNLQLSQAASGSETVAEVSQWFIDAGYREGDQVTVITGWVPIRLAFAWNVKSFYLSLTDDTPISNLGISIDTNDDNYLQMLGHDYADAVAIAVSRDGDGVNLRSTSYAATDPTTVDAVYYGDAMYEMAKRSYMNTSATRSTNWPIDPGSEGYTPVVQSAFTRAGVEFTPVGVRVVDPGQNQYLCIYDGEGNNYYIESYESSSSSLRVFLSGTGATTSAQPTGMTTANSVDVYDTNNVDAGLRAWLISKGVSATVLPVRS